MKHENGSAKLLIHWARSDHHFLVTHVSIPQVWKETNYKIIYHNFCLHLILWLFLFLMSMTLSHWIFIIVIHIVKEYIDDYDYWFVYLWMKFKKSFHCKSACRSIWKNICIVCFRINVQVRVFKFIFSFF